MFYTEVRKDVLVVANGKPDEPHTKEYFLLPPHICKVRNQIPAEFDSWRALGKIGDAITRYRLRLFTTFAMTDIDPSQHRLHIALRRKPRRLDEFTGDYFMHSPSSDNFIMHGTAWKILKHENRGLFIFSDFFGIVLGVDDKGEILPADPPGTGLFEPYWLTSPGLEDLANKLAIVLGCITYAEGWNRNYSFGETGEKQSRAGNTRFYLSPDNVWLPVRGYKIGFSTTEMDWLSGLPETLFTNVQP